MTAAQLRVTPYPPTTVEAEMCPECRALLPPCDTADREVHITRCERMTVLLRLVGPHLDTILEAAERLNHPPSRPDPLGYGEQTVWQLPAG